MSIFREAVVLVSYVVDGAVRRRTPRKNLGEREVAVVVVLPVLLAAATAACRPGERLHIVSEREVWMVYE